MINMEGIVKVADLGLVKLPGGEQEQGVSKTEVVDPASDGLGSASTSSTEHLTRAGSVMGTPAYMSPEQSRDSASVDARADVYSLGCSLYVLLTGKPPFAGKTALEVISKHQTEPLIPPDARY
jgi:serine/threonine protein kinase